MKTIIIILMALALAGCSTKTTIQMAGSEEVYTVVTKYNGKVGFEGHGVKFTVDNTGPTSLIDKLIGAIAISEPQIGVD